MRRTIASAALLFLALPLSAQTIQIIELSADDSAQARAAQEKLAQTQADWVNLQQSMYVQYAMPTNAFFSDDFKFLIGSGDPAPIRPLADADTAKLAAASDAMVQAQKDADSMRRHIFALYVRDAKPKPDTFPNPQGAPPPRFTGFRYTADYRFVLPQ